MKSFGTSLQILTQYCIFIPRFLPKSNVKAYSRLASGKKLRKKQKKDKHIVLFKLKDADRLAGHKL